jgi:hypothetical protein
MIANINLVESPFHALRNVASFALLGAAIAGSMTILPVFSSQATTIDLQAIGAIVGGVTGAIAQVFRV